MIADGETQLAQGAYGEAEAIFEKALLLDDVATEASVGYWRAKTEDFSSPDVLIAEYVEGIRDGLSEEELQEEEQWLQEIIESTKENGMHSFPVAGATLLHYESLGLWDIEDDD